MINVTEIDKRNLCIGCGLCVSVAENELELCVGEDGFYHPQGRVSNERLMGLIQSACPGLEVTAPDPVNEPSEKIWGPIRKACRAYSTDEEIRWQASAGGALSGVLLYLLEHEKVSGVIHIGSSAANPVLNQVSISRNRTDILRKVGSRYQPAVPLGSILQILKQETGMFAFVGKPCDVSALRQFLEVESKWKPRIPYMLSFFCGGMPSMNGTREMLKTMEVSEGDVSAFRYRGHGWPGKAAAIDRGGKVHELEYEASWGKILSRHVHWRCKICADSVGFSGDIVFGDAWEEKNGGPDFSESPGKSLVLARNDKGAQLFEEAVRQGYLKEESYDIEKLQRAQPYQYHRRRTASARHLAAWVGGFRYPRYRGFPFLNLFIWGDKKVLFLEFMNTLSHLKPRNTFRRVFLKVLIGTINRSLAFARVFKRKD